MSKIKLCFLISSPSLSEGLYKLNHISRAQLLKLGLKNSQLKQKVEVGREYSLPLAVINFNKINPNYSGPEVRVIAESEDIIALSKPAKIHCHPLHYEESNNLLSFLRARGETNLLQVNKSVLDRGLLYRLDFETSGLCLLAKNDLCHEKVRADFKNQVLEKKYIAIVEGIIQRRLVLGNYLKPHGPKGQKMVENKQGKLAHISVSPLEHKGNETLVEVSLSEGLRHQIRTQLSLAGYPIKGDVLYGAQRADRVYLHCWKYKLKHLGEFEDRPDLIFELFSFNR